jgi:plastocyanin
VTKRVPAILLALGLGLGWLLAVPSTAATNDVTIDMSLRGFDPSSVEVKTGTTVIWHNIETSDYPVVSGHHQVEADDGTFASPRIAPGARWSFTFLKPGTFSYHCVIHPTMTGELVAVGNPITAHKPVRVDIVEPDPNNERSWGYEPKEITLETGTKVTWANNGNQEHTVTAKSRAFDSNKLAPGQTFEFTLNSPGVYRYTCTPHPWMTGTVRVHDPGEAVPDAPEAQEAAPPPPAAPASPARSADGGSVIYNANIVEGLGTESWGYDPRRLLLRVGDSVVWKNTGSIDHTVTADDNSFDSKELGSGRTFRQIFATAGTYAYHCTPHPFMKGVVVVLDAEGNAPPPKAKPGERVLAASGGADRVEIASTSSGRSWWMLAVASIAVAVACGLVVGRRMLTGEERA